MFSTPEHLAHASLRLCGFRSRRVATSVGRVHVLDAPGRGALPPTVMLHGFSSAALHYAPLIQRLRPHVQRVVAPDMPAHGYSDVPRFGINPDALRRGLFDALDAVIDRPVVLFGNSMGGLAAIRYALARPQNVRALVLVSPGGAAMSTAELGAFVRSFAMDSHDDALAFVDRMMARRAPELVRPFLAWGIRQKFGHKNMRTLLASLTSEDLLEPAHLAQLTMPTLFVWGRGDRILPTSCREFFRRHLPAHVRIEEPEGFSHSPYLEEPEAVNSLLLRFLREVAAVRPATSAVGAAPAMPAAMPAPIVTPEAMAELSTNVQAAMANAKKPDHVAVAGLSLTQST